ncbi:hypothetical protein OFK41_07940 [Acinetobacter baumannii]|nr:hypothetical protein [Acinetobacter baumannii]MCX3034138.1 hypothetical protein [Acinetobacter baumannii]
MPEAISYMDLEGMELQAAVNHFTDFEFYFLSDLIMVAVMRLN